MNISCSRLLQRACLFSLMIRKAILSSYWSVMDKQALWLAETVTTSVERPFSGFTTSQTWLWLWTRDLKLNPAPMLVIPTHNLKSESGNVHLLLVQSLNAQGQCNPLELLATLFTFSCEINLSVLWTHLLRFRNGVFVWTFCFISFPINTFHSETFTSQSALSIEVAAELLSENHFKFNLNVAA